MIVYTKSAGINPASVGRLETPIKMIIERESEMIRNTPSVFNTVFNVEKSNHFGETLPNMSDFTLFRKVDEGSAAPIDKIVDRGSKFIEHVQYMKEFIITADAMEDSAYAIDPTAKHKAENFVRAYYKSLDLLCTKALTGATATSIDYLGTKLDLTSPDGQPLFSACHPLTENPVDDSELQCNHFWGNIMGNGSEDYRIPDVNTFHESLSLLVDYFRNMKDDNGVPIGYTPDIIMIPGNRPYEEAVVRQVCGSYNTAGTSNNDLNIHYGKFKIIVLPYWSAEKDQVILMSSAANKELRGNMLFNRVPLTVTNWVDNHTGNYVWTGRCRFGIGFGNYKHIMLATDTSEEVPDALSIYHKW